MLSLNIQSQFSDYPKIAQMPSHEFDAITQASNATPLAGLINELFFNKNLGSLSKRVGVIYETLFSEEFDQQQRIVILSYVFGFIKRGACVEEDDTIAAAKSLVAHSQSPDIPQKDFLDILARNASKVMFMHSLFNGPYEQYSQIAEALLQELDDLEDIERIVVIAVIFTILVVESSLAQVRICPACERQRTRDGTLEFLTHEELCQAANIPPASSS